ncbi:MAG: hypothetical protein HY831_03885 [Candidatus Aenigmarchaeota archaeon]|nr:hypothetical protein [Candidatus Aenigmarchaeota archaeon]
MKMYTWLRNAVLGIGTAVMLAAPVAADNVKTYPTFNKGYNTVEASADTKGNKTYRLTTNNSIDFENFTITHNGINNYFSAIDKIKGTNRIAVGPKEYPIKAVGVFKLGAKTGYLKGGIRYTLSKTGFLDVVTNGDSIEAGVVYPMTLVKGDIPLTGRIIAGAEHYMTGKKKGKTDLVSELELNAFLNDSLFGFGRATLSSSKPKYEIGIGVKF